MSRAQTTPATAVGPASGPGWLGRTMFGIRLVAIVEIVGLLAAMMAVDLLWFDATRFIEITPHPFWLVVLLVSVQYGTVEGLVAAGLCSVVLLAGNLPTQTLDGDYFGWRIAVAARPIMWAAAAVVLGELVNRHRRRITDLAGSLDTAQSERGELQASLTDLRRAHEKLELALAADLHTELALRRSAGRLHGTTVESVIDGARDLLAAALKPSRFSLYLLNRGQLRLIHCDGWASAGEYPGTFNPGDPIFDHIVQGRRELSVNRAEDQAILNGNGVLAGALRLPDQGVVLGMLKIERLPFQNFSYASLENFRAICELIAAALANVSRLQAPQAAAAPAAGPTAGPSPGDALLDASHLRAPLKALAWRHGFGLCAIEIQLAPETTLSTPNRHKLSRVVARACRSIVPDHGIVGTDGKPRGDLLVLLPGASEGEARTLARAIERGLAAAMPGDRLGRSVAARAQCLAVPRTRTPPAFDGDNVLPFHGRV